MGQFVPNFPMPTDYNLNTKIITKEMKRLFTLLLVSSLAFANTSSYEDYTYQTDKSFTTIENLVGKTFVPNAYMEGVGNKAIVEAGDVKVHIGADFVAFDGVDGLHYFNVTDKKPSYDGYSFNLVDLRGSNLSEFTVVTDPAYQVQLLHLNSRKYGEHTFFLPQKSKEELKAEHKYFTPKNITLIAAYGMLIDKTINPYKELADYTNPAAVTEKVSMKRDLNVSFSNEQVTVNSKVAAEDFAYDIKKVKIKEVSSTKVPYAVKMFEMKVKRNDNKVRKVKVFLNAVNQIEFIELKDTRYFLR